MNCRFCKLPLTRHGNALNSFECVRHPDCLVFHRFDLTQLDDMIRKYGVHPDSARVFDAIKEAEKYVCVTLIVPHKDLYYKLYFYPEGLRVSRAVFNPELNDWVNEKVVYNTDQCVETITPENVKEKLATILTFL